MVEDSYDELAGGKVFYSKVLRLETLLRAITRFLEGAVFFTVSFIVALSIRLVKNKALGESFNLEGWLPAQLKPLKISLTLLLAV